MPICKEKIASPGKSMLIPKCPSFCGLYLGPVLEEAYIGTPTRA
jgi:hypothetical protein